MTGSSPIAPKAGIPNPALEPLAFLVGDWRTTGNHPAFPGVTLAGRSSFTWHEGGAFLIMRSEVDHEDFPDGVAIFASDDTAGTLAMTYFDERGTSRLLTVTAGNEEATWRHDDPEFLQTLTIRRDGERLVSQGRMKRSGKDWGDDLSQVFDRSPP
jgi:hypothetical protein